MKKLIFALLLAPLFWSCGSDDDNSGGGGGGNSMSAKVNGTAWTAGLAVQGNKSTGSPVVLTLAGTGNGGQINISIVNYNGPGTYTISNGLTAVYTNTSTLAVYTATMGLGSGTVTVSSEANNVVQGTFSFNGTQAGGAGTAAVTEGAFNISI